MLINEISLSPFTLPIFKKRNLKWDEHLLHFWVLYLFHYQLRFRLNAPSWRNSTFFAIWNIPNYNRRKKAFRRIRNWKVSNFQSGIGNLHSTISFQIVSKKLRERSNFIDSSEKDDTLGQGWKMTPIWRKELEKIWNFLRDLWLSKRLNKKRNWPEGSLKWHLTFLTPFDCHYLDYNFLWYLAWNGNSNKTFLLYVSAYYMKLMPTFLR